MNHRSSSSQQKQPNFIPTIIIMSVVLFSILYFGDKISDSVAILFTNDDPEIDAAAAENAENATAGQTINAAYIEASKHILTIVARPANETVRP